jgi:hypothetical protein
MFDELKWWAFRLAISPAVWMLIILVLALGAVGRMDLEDAIRSQSHYCEMVKLYKESGGVSGWPDYDLRYDQDCLDRDPG